MVMVLETVMVEEIARIGRYRHPNEACGLLLPVPWRGQQVIELPNRSKLPHDSFTLTGEDMMVALDGFFPEEVTEEFMSGITAWHTHPGGGLGPSKADMENKPAFIQSLVVTLYEDGRPAKATWY